MNSYVESNKLNHKISEILVINKFGDSLYKKEFNPICNTNDENLNSGLLAAVILYGEVAYGNQSKNCIKEEHSVTKLEGNCSNWLISKSQNIAVAINVTTESFLNYIPKVVSLISSNIISGFETFIAYMDGMSVEKYRDYQSDFDKFIDSTIHEHLEDLSPYIRR
ncbi:MAG: hypothetical protein OEZ01_01415 [Candidatus Heimdallarchaeota archaeon]|nr:hypothetical protein [Candidatus Heimdallarchaeota archaeon]MDH5644632.1 hypothetical protein [Candidatus Heimdallarchaeota archaeon]